MAFRSCSIPVAQCPSLWIKQGEGTVCVSCRSRDRNDEYMAVSTQINGVAQRGQVDTQHHCSEYKKTNHHRNAPHKTKTYKSIIKQFDIITVLTLFGGSFKALWVFDYSIATPCTRDPTTPMSLPHTACEPMTFIFNNIK